jgi:hypothetical protein
MAQMLSKTTAVVAMAATLLVGVVIGTRAQPPANAAEVPAVQQRWEYALFDRAGAWALVTPSKRALGTSMDEMLTQFTGVPQKSVSYPQIVNLLGADGWELSSVVTTPRGGTEMWFKRPAR